MKSKTNKRAIVALSMAIVLLFGIVVSGILTDWYTDGNKFCLFGHEYGADGKCAKCGALKEPDVVPSLSELGGLEGVVAAENYGMRLRAVRAATQSDEATADTWTLTATVNAGATDKYVNWTVAWESEAPATGDTVAANYISVQPSSEGALTATVKCLKPFSKPINVVVTSRSNTEQSAVCKFDYIKKITGITVNMPNISATSSTFSYQVQLSEGTVEPTVSVNVGNMYLTNAFVVKILNYMQSMYADADFNSLGFRYANLTVANNQISMIAGNKVIAGDAYNHTVDMKNVANYTQLSGDYTYASHAVAGAFLGFSTSDVADLPDAAACLTNVFRAAVLACTDTQATFDVTGTATYGEKTFTFTTTINCHFDGSALTVPVSSIVLDQTHIYF